jgi:hypothetical protein
VCFNELFKQEYMAIGDINNSSIAEIWHGSFIEGLRADQLEGRRTEGVPCNECQYCQPLGSPRQTSEHQVRAYEGA